MKYLLLSTLLFSACSLLSKGGKDDDMGIYKRLKNAYALEENSGKFYLIRERGVRKSSNEFVVKREVYPEDRNKSKILEKSISISKIGNLKKTVKILRPHQSQYVVWFDGKKYSNEIKLNTTTRKLELKLDSPEKQWQGKREFDLPNTNAVYCFFNQVIECAQVTGFISKAYEKGFGKMNFYVIWNGFPYFHEQYLNLEQSIFSKAVLEYDGQDKKTGELKFSLNTSGQAIFYILNDSFKLKKKFWISQGLSMLMVK